MKTIAENRKKFTHFKYEERLVLEFYLKGSNRFPKITNTGELAAIFNKSRRSIQREINRGMIEHETSITKTKFEYNADFAQGKAEYEMTAKGAPLKLGNDNLLVEKIRELIINQKYSPYAVIQKFNNSSWPTKTRISEKTLYNYIENDVLPGLTIMDLPNKGRKYNKSKRKPHFSRVGCAIRSISNRPEYINNRSEVGHWEIDTVKSCADSTVECALTLTERKTRAEIIRKMPNAEADSVVNEINKLEDSLGPELFRKLFKSITADGGSEFMDFSGIENSKNGRKRTCLYFAHPYCASERGTNENHNRIFRRFYPKGTDFSKLNPKLFAEVQEWMNNYPRKILKGSTPELELQKHIGMNFKIPI